MKPARVLVRIGVAVVGVATVAVVGMVSGGSAAASGSMGSPTAAAPPVGGPPSGDPSGPAAAVSPQALNQQPQLEDGYVPITPCRIADTRLGGGRFGDLTTRTYLVAGTTGFAAQGGSAAGCGIPLGATAVTANITANTPSTAGFVRAWPSAIATEPNATVVNYSKGQQVTGAATLAITPGVAASLKVRNHHGPVDLAIDVTGYYVPPIEGLIYTGSTATPTTDGYVYSGSPRILSVTWVALGIADVTVDRDVTYCTAVANAYYGDYYYANAKAFNGNKVRVYSWSIDPTTHATAYANNYVYLIVVC